MEHAALWRLIADKAIPSGARQIELTSYEWDVGAYCDDPQSITHHCRTDDQLDRQQKWRVNPGSLTLHMTGLPCRKCARCMYVRARKWRERAERENAFWPRTWFCTFTFRPEVHHAMLMSALAEKNRSGWKDTDFSETDENRVRLEEVGRQMTRFLKRVRKPLSGEKPVGLRYLWVTELHKSGLPHAHALLHESGGPLTYRRITSRWHLGFCNASLIDNGKSGAKYVAKYISKGAEGTRIRASLNYGEPESKIIALNA